MKIHNTQCDSCAFLITEDQSTIELERSIDKKHLMIHSLKGAPKNLRKLTVGFGVTGINKTETCFIRSPLFPSKVNKIYCPDRVDSCLSLETALELRDARDARKIAFDAARWAKWATIIATTAIIIASKDQILWSILYLLK
jgi:hypothetical protein